MVASACWPPQDTSLHNSLGDPLVIWILGVDSNLSLARIPLGLVERRRLISELTKRMAIFGVVFQDGLSGTSWGG